ncbi:hypothetical protein GOB57_22040 [Sinorhizobium meliloti]|nr:hypothetical protein [Sinorhizobium meliloti]
MSSDPAKRVSKGEFEAIAADVFDRLWELTPWPKEEFEEKYRTGMIERWRGQKAAATKDKRDFIESALNTMVCKGHISAWANISGKGRADYKVDLASGRIAVIEAKGSLDGNSATIMERPSYADELVVWTMTTNPMSDVHKNIWSGIHSRISPEHIVAGKRVDVLMAWDQLGSSVILRPGLADLDYVAIAGAKVPPPCLFLLPHELPIINVRNPVRPKRLSESEFASAVCSCFGVTENLVGSAEFELALRKSRLARRTTVSFAGEIYKTSDMRTIRRDMSAYSAAATVEAERLARASDESHEV